MKTEVVAYQFETITVSAAARAVWREGQRVELEPKALRLLLFLIENRHRAVTKDEIIASVWDGAAVTDNAITRLVAQIRRELGDDPRRPRYIETLPTTGYRFVATVHVESANERVGEAEVAARTPVAKHDQRVVLVASVVAALVLMIPLARWAISRVERVEFPAKAIQMTTSTGLDVGASFSPDRRELVYSSSRDGWFEIYRRPLAGSGAAVPITRDGNQNIEPAWSPDGKWIAYHSVGQHGIWRIPAGGGTAQRLTSFGSAPAWSPDSRTIAFTSVEPYSFAAFDTGGGGPATLWTVAADGSQLRQLTTLASPRGSHSMPSWSPDGKRLVYVAFAPTSVIHTLDLHSGKSEPLVEVGRDIPRQPGTWVTRLWDPKFSPTGEGIYFSAMGENAEYAIYFLAKAGGRPQRVYSTGTDSPTGLAVSPDGRKLLFTRVWNAGQLWKAAEGSQLAPVFRESVQRVYLPNFSPDGKWLAFLVEIAGRNRDLWIRRAEGGDAVPVTTDPGPKEGNSTWTVDGKLLYNYVDGTRTEFRSYDPVTHQTRVLLARETAGLFHPVMMPNGKDLLAACSRPLNLCIGPAADTNSLRQLTFERQGAIYPFSSRDGQWIGFQIQRGDSTQLAVMRADGSQQKVLTDDPGHSWGYSFSPDDRQVAFAAYRGGVWNIWSIDRVTGERRQLTHETAFGSFVRSPAWRPGSNGEVVYESFQVRGNIFLLSRDAAIP